MKKRPRLSLSEFSRELKRRRVYPTLVAYALVAWILLQIGEVTFAPLGLPDWVMTGLVVVVIVGFPVVLVLSWVFDIKMTGLSAVAPQEAGATTDPPSIAVLPFADMSSDHNQEHLGEGIAEEILNALRKIPQLSIAARMSSFQFKERAGDIRDIGRELGVKAVLEGSVIKSGNRLRVTVQLVKVADGNHLWSKSFDEELKDIFAIQDEIATGVAQAMLDTPMPVKTSANTDVAVYLSRSPAFTEVPSGDVAYPLPDKPFIAVLPFANISGDPDQEYFAEGITEDITTDLSKFGLFFVISRNSSFAYKGTSVDVKHVARELGAQYVLEGSVRKLGDRVRITSQLIDAIEDKHIWAERYDRKIEDIFEVQDEITRSIVTSVAPEYLSAEVKRAQRKETRILDAWDSFMRGYWHFMRFTKDDNATAQRLLGEAIERDPNQANYHGMLAVARVMAVFYGWSESRDQSFREALESAERGLALDDQDAQVIRSAGIVHFFMKNHDIALAYYKRAVKANPYEAESRALLGAALGVAGDYDAALHQFETAMRLSPRDLHIATWYNYLGIAAFVVGRAEEAAEWSVKTAQSNPQFPGGHRTLAASYGNLGRLTEAATAREKLQALQPHLTIAQLRVNLPYFKKPDDLERYLEGLRRAGLPE